MKMGYKSAIAAVHIFMAFFVGVQSYAFYISYFQENMPVLMTLFVVLSTVIFYFAFKKADPRYYNFKHVFVLTAGYWTLSSIILFAQLAYLNVFLVAAFFYYLIRKNPAQTFAAEAA